MSTIPSLSKKSKMKQGWFLKTWHQDRFSRFFGIAVDIVYGTNRIDISPLVAIPKIK